jgi:SHS2 domain-containing protein
MNNFEILSSAAEVSIKAWGATRAGLLKSALQGMFSVAGAHYVDGGAEQKRRFEIKGADFTALVAAILNQALTVSATQHEAYQDLSFELVTETEVKGFFVGRPVTEFKTQLKSVVAQELEIKRRDDEKWEAIVKFEI